MGLNDIRLTGALLADLYPRSLVDTGEASASALNAAPPEETAPAPVTGEMIPAGSPGESLPATGPGPAEAPVAAATQWKFLGNNKKRVLVVVDYAGTAYLPDEELNFLTRMLTACKFGLDDVAIVNSAHYPGEKSAAYLRQFGSTQVLLFGRDPAAFGLPMSFPVFQVQTFAGTAFLSAPPLGAMMEDKELKGQLWTSLKRMFNL
ncbi:MAG: hypothetical protein EOO09_07520 [Chitinophagaceae bacterium]|nr:MAG: hypothetical protein EOO09_07520 [Chitinophagaceae bacterium]